MEAGKQGSLQQQNGFNKLGVSRPIMGAGSWEQLFR
jgi:hypothetical protein